MLQNCRPFSWCSLLGSSIFCIMIECSIFKYSGGGVLLNLIWKTESDFLQFISWILSLPSSLFKNSFSAHYLIKKFFPNKIITIVSQLFFKESFTNCQPKFYNIIFGWSFILRFLLIRSFLEIYFYIWFRGLTVISRLFSEQDSAAQLGRIRLNSCPWRNF